MPHLWRYGARAVIEYTNSAVARIIDEYIHSERDRAIIKRRLIDGSYRRRRDSMGRYSRDGYSNAEKEDELHEIVNQLRSMAKDLPQPTQRAIQNFTDMVG